MCIVFLWKQERSELYGKFKFILAANRDELFHRSAKESHFWKDYQHILAGQDLSKSYENGYGTWLGVTKYGKISYLTNFPAAICKGDNLKGRGELVSDFLKNDMSGYNYLSSLQSEKGLYGPFNLVCGNVKDELYYTRNVLDDDDNPIKPIQKGFSYMTNDILECQWLKAVNGLKLLSGILQNYTSEENLHDELLTLLEDSTSYHPDPAMPVYDTSNVNISSIFVPLLSKNQYGTRTNTIVTVDKDNYMTFLERTKTELNQTPSQWLKSVFTFKMEEDSDDQSKI